MRRLLLFILIAGFSGCETERITFSGPYHIRFTESEQTEKESNSQIIRIEVHNVGPELDEDVTVNYSISGDSREGVDYEILGTKGRVVIEEGEYFGYIEVKLINNANNILRSQDLIFTLTTANAKGLQVGQGEGGIGKKFTLTILDDCILSGTYDGTRQAFSIPTKDIRVISTDCENYVLSNWDVGIFDAADPVPLSFVDNGDNTLTIPSQDLEVFFGFPTIDVNVEGVGSVNPITREIFLSLKFYDLDDDSGEKYEVTITLQPE